MTEQEEFEFRARKEKEEAEAKAASDEKYVNPAVPTQIGGIVGGLAGLRELPATIAEPVANRIASAFGMEAPSKTNLHPLSKWIMGEFTEPKITEGGINKEQLYQKNKVAAGLPVKSAGNVSKTGIRRGVPFQPEPELTFGQRAANFGKAAIKAPVQAPGWMAEKVGAFPLTRAGSGALSGYNLTNAYNALVDPEANAGDVAVNVVGGVAPLAGTFAKSNKLRGAGIGLGTGAALYDYIRQHPGYEEDEKAAGGAVQGYADGKQVLAKGALDLLKKSLPAAGKARQLVQPTAEEIAQFVPKPTQQGKFSDFIQNHMGEYLGIHQSDRLGTHGNYKGGTNFPNFQNINPLHAINDIVWLNNDPNAANKLIKNTKINDKDVIWTNYIGKENQHKSNRGIFNEILEDVYKNNPNISEEQAMQIAARMKTLTGKDLDIRDKFLMQEIGGESFDSRGKLSDMFGLGFGRGKDKVILSPNYQNILDSSAEEFTKGAPTSAIGTRLHRIYDEPSQYSTAFHPDYDYTVHGKDMGVQFPAVPHTILDWTQNYVKEGRGGKGSTLPHGNAWMSYMRDPQYINDTFVKRAQSEGFATGGQIQGYADAGLVKKGVQSALGFLKPAAKSHSQDVNVARALEDYLKGNISQEERIAAVNKYLPLRPWTELPPAYTDEQIRMALMENKRPKALIPVPEGMRVGNRLDIPAYIQNGVYIDTTHAATGNKSPISYNRTGHLKDVEFGSDPDKAFRIGLGTKPQALTPMAAEWGADKKPFARIEGTNVGTSDEEVRRMMAEYLKDPNWAQVGMDPRRHSQFYDKATGMPVWSAEEKLQSGPLVLVPKRGLETTTWDDPRLNLTDFPGKQYAEGGSSTPAWQRKEGKNPEGGLNAVGRASYNRETGGNLKPPVSAEQAKKSPTSAARRKSFCARMSGNPGPMKDENGKPTRKALALKKWDC